jgi:very-short-patch-repair endonuclease
LSKSTATIALQVEADSRRTSVLAQEGWHVLRFAANEAVAIRKA